MNTNQGTWRELSEVPMVHVMFLIGEDQGDTKRAKLEHNMDILEGLTEVEKTLFRNLTRF